MISFQSSTFSGSESSGVIMATVIISGGIVSSRDINVPISFTAGTATGGVYCNCTYNVAKYIGLAIWLENFEG